MRGGTDCLGVKQGEGKGRRKRELLGLMRLRFKQEFGEGSSVEAPWERGMPRYDVRRGGVEKSAGLLLS